MITAAAVVLADAGRLPTGIPPWMGLAIVAGWLAVVAVALRLFRWRRSARTERRAAAARRSGRADDRDGPSDRQLGSGDPERP